MKEYSYAEEEELFQEVKGYIRENVVNEFQVAEHFQIPVKLVKKWIKEERIQYVYTDEAKIKNTRCAICSKPVLFGTICRDCQKKLRMSGTFLQVTTPGQMYTFDSENNVKFQRKKD